MGLGKLVRSTNNTYGIPSRVIKTVITDVNAGTSQTFFGTAMGGFFDEGQDHYRGMMAIPGAWKSCALLTDFLARVPWHAYSDVDGVQVRRGSQPKLLEQPNPPWSRIDTFSSMALDLIWHGNSISIITDRYSDGTPMSLHPYPAANVGVRVNGNTGEIEYRFGGEGSRNSPGGGGLILTSEDVVHIKGMHAPGQLRGMGVLETHLTTLNTSREQVRATREFTDSAVPTGVLTTSDPEMDNEKAERLKARWRESQRTRTIAVVNSATEFKPIAWNPSELQMIEARKFTLQEIALIFGVPLSFLGVETASRTYRNDESEDNNLLKYSVAGHLNRFEETLSLKFPRGTIIRANLDAVLRANTKDRYAAHQVGVMTGFLLRSEVRTMENLPPIPGIDDTPLPSMTQGVVGGSTEAIVADALDEGRVPDRSSPQTGGDA